jgi:hypothetical protein
MSAAHGVFQFNRLLANAAFPEQTRKADTRRVGCYFREPPFFFNGLLHTKECSFSA